jgi:hypothetical protein
MLKTSRKTATTFVTFFNFSLRLAAISERFELESSDWTNFLRLFKLELKINRRLGSNRTWMVQGGNHTGAWQTELISKTEARCAVLMRPEGARPVAARDFCFSVAKPNNLKGRERTSDGGISKIIELGKMR